MKRKTRMLLCSLTYRIAREVKKNVLLFGLKNKEREINRCSQPNKSKGTCCLGNYFGIILYRMLILTINLVKT